MISDLHAFIHECERRTQPQFEAVGRVALANQERVLQAFWTHRVSQSDLLGSTGYGLSDVGRDKFEQVFANVFGAESALVRPQIVSGTHAITLALFGVLRPGDQLVMATGMPYDTLHGVVGFRKAPGSLDEFGVTADVVPLLEDGRVDIDAVSEKVGKQTKIVLFQRSRGYAERPALTVDELETAFATIRSRHPHVIIAVDNCYGEFVELQEPSHVGADLVMGSLIKNPGAGIAPTGGYVVGRRTLIELAAARLVAPGTAAEYGPTGPYMQSFYQALFLAPHVVSQALKGSLLFAEALSTLGFEVSPSVFEQRADLILAITLHSRERLLAFCRAIQSSAPIDAHVRPEASTMAGYEDEVVMAAGTFIQGASLELSADAPMRPPYTVYVQGGLTYEHTVIALKNVIQSVYNIDV